jgi:hypothetical protein
MSQHNLHQSAQRVNPLRPSLEALEDRFLLNCVLDLDRGAAAGGRDLLTVHGTTRGDTIWINDGGDRGVGQVNVSCFDGFEWTSAGDDADIGEIRIFAGYGADHVVYTLWDDLSAPRLYNIDLGESDDTFAAYLSSCVWHSASVPWGLDGYRECNGHDLKDGANLDLRVRGGNGRDTIRAYADQDVDVAAGAILSFLFAGDGGDDTIGVYYSGDLDGRFAMIADGGSHNDTVTAVVNLNAGSEGRLGDVVRPAQVRDGGGGDDDLTFLVADNSHGEAEIFATMVFTDWGFGDEANFLPPVRVIW